MKNQVMKFYFLCILITLAVYSCNRKPVNRVELYGNSFIELDDEDFHAPAEWNTLCLMDSAFQVSIPPYMRRTESDSTAIVFSYRDTISNGDFHYGRIGITYFRIDNSFNKATDYINVYESNTRNILDQMIAVALQGGEMAHGIINVPDGEIINGPFYECHSMKVSDDYHHIHAVDAFYRRKGHIKGMGAVSCHIFFLQNRDEAVKMTISYYDKDSVLFDNLFNVVKTFKWNRQRW